MSRVPISLESGVKKLFCGPESFTHDLAPIIGEAPNLQNYFVAAGLNSIGILSAGGLGRVMAHWILNGKPDVDVTGFNIDRVHRYLGNRAFRADRACEALGGVYRCHYPTEAKQTCRGVRQSVLHDRLAAAGAYFIETSGWESPAWFAPSGVKADVERLSFGKMNWFPYWQAEHKACREGVTLMDMSLMSKFLVQGRDAGTVLDFIAANNVNGDTGVITYTQFLNEDGMLEADVTVAKLACDKYMVVVTDTMHHHVETWLNRHIPERAHAIVTDVTSATTQINIQGPQSRALLRAISSANFASEAFPYRGVKDIDIGYARALCVRISYAGELGYELYVPCDQALHAYDRLIKAGQQFGLVHAGLSALGSLRLEKGYRDYGHDIDNTDDPFETGLGFAVALDKPGGFIGWKAAAAKKSSGPLKRRLVSVLVEDPDPMLWHAEVISKDGQELGYVRAGSYGHTLGGAVGLAMIEAGEIVDADYLNSGNWTINIAGTQYPCRCSLAPLYDPKMERIKV